MDFGRQDRFHAFPRIAADDAIDVKGRPGTQPFDQGIVRVPPALGRAVLGQPLLFQEGVPGQQMTFFVERAWIEPMQAWASTGQPLVDPRWVTPASGRR